MESSMLPHLPFSFEKSEQKHEENSLFGKHINALIKGL